MPILTEPARSLHEGMVGYYPSALRYCKIEGRTTAPIAVGSVVALTADGQNFKPLNDAGDNIVGIAAYSPSLIKEYVDGVLYVPEGEMPQTLEKGEIVVYSEVPVVYNDPVYARIVAGVAPLDVLPAFRNAEVIGETVLIEDFRFAETTTAPGLVWIIGNK